MEQQRKMQFYIVVLLTLFNVIDSSQRPEITLLDLLAKPFGPTEGASRECLRDSQIYFAELSKYNPWALQMYDASAKIPPGVITGNFQQLGNYDECLKIKTGQQFLAQACSASVQFEILKGPRTSVELDMKDLLMQVAKASNMKDMPSYSVDYEWMWCVPSTCNHSEISEALELALDPLKVDGRLDFVVNLNANSCRTSITDTNRFDITDWCYTGVLLIVLASIVASTAYDLHIERATKETDCKGMHEPFKHTLLTSFSLYTNGKQIFNTDRHKNAIGCLDGLRYLSICWIICGHTIYLEAVGVQLDRSYIPKLHENWASLLFLNGNIVTDTFLLLSGILLAYTSLMKSSKEVRPSVNVLNLYLNRYFRLTPAYAIVVGFYATLFDKLGSGPRWNVWIHNSKLDCRNNWWTNLLYINNYVNVANMCMSQSWYLSVDMQLLWLSPIFLYPMIKYNRSIIFWTVTGVGTMASICIPFFITYFLHLTGTMLYYKNPEDVTNVYLQIYIKVYTRAGPYIIGLALGYILFKTKGYKIRIPSVYVLCGWLIAITAGMSAVLGPRGMYFSDHQYNRLEASFYAGLHRHVFTLAVSWIIFACVNGYAGPINTFLSWRAWIPLSRMTYCTYLSHYIVLLYSAGSARTASYTSIYTAAHAFFGNLCLTMFIALCLSCCFEMPCMVLVRLLLSPRKKNESAGLAAKPSAELIYGSTDSGEGIYRSTDDIADSESTSVDDVFTISKIDYCTYDVESKDVNVAEVNDERHCRLYVGDR